MIASTSLDSYHFMSHVTSGDVSFQAACHVHMSSCPYVIIFFHGRFAYHVSCHIRSSVMSNYIMASIMSRQVSRQVHQDVRFLDGEYDVRCVRRRMERDTSVKSRNPGRGLVDRQQSSRDEFIRTLTNLGHKCELEPQTRK